MPGPNDKNVVTLKRPDGTTLAVPEDQAGRMEVLGYTRETQAEQISRVSAQDTHDYYSGVGQGIATAFEGALAGATLGLSDPVLEALGDEHIAGRAEHRPVIRLGSELVGAIGASLLAGPEAAAGLEGAEAAKAAGTATRIANATPAGALAKALESHNALARGAIEGGLYGVGGQVSRSTLTDDPFTAEAVLSSVGWGSLYGSGLSVLGAGLGRATDKAQAALSKADDVAEKVGGAASKEAKTASEMIPHEHWQSLHAEAKNVSSIAHEVSESLGDELKNATASKFTGIPERARAPIQAEFTGLEKAGNELTSAAVAAGNKGALRAIRKAWEAANDGAKSGNMELLQGGMAKYRAALEDWAGNLHTNVKLPPVATILAESGSRAGEKAFKDAADLASVAETLGTFPKTAKAWVAMPASRAEALHAALDKALKIDIPELAPHQFSLKEAMLGVSTRLGRTDQEPLKAMQGSWRALREADSARTLKSIDKIVRDGGAEGKGGTGGGVGFFANLVAYKTAKAIGKSVGLAPAGSYALFRGLRGAMKGPASEILGLRGLVTDRLKTAVDGLAGGAGLLEKAGGRFDPLMTRLDGSRDNEPYKNRGELFLRRKKEIAGAANSVHDTLFRAVQPIHVDEPHVARAIHASAVQAYTALYDAMPKSANTAFSLFKPLGVPDPVAIERFSRTYQMFHEPHALISSMFDGSVPVTSDHAKALANVWPALAAELRAHMLESITDPEQQAQMSSNYKNMHSRSLLLGIPLHSTSTPEFIAAQQAMFSQRNGPPQGQTGTPTGGSSSGGGRPAATSQATQSQNVTER